MRDTVKFRYKAHSFWRTSHKWVRDPSERMAIAPRTHFERERCERPGCERTQWSDTIEDIGPIELTPDEVVFIDGFDGDEKALAHLHWLTPEEHPAEVMNIPRRPPFSGHVY